MACCVKYNLFSVLSDSHTGKMVCRVVVLPWTTALSSCTVQVLEYMFNFITSMYKTWEVNLSLCTSWRYVGNEGIAPVILNLSTRWRKWLPLLSRCFNAVDRAPDWYLLNGKYRTTVIVIYLYCNKVILFSC